MAYTKTNWQDNVTPVSATNLNKIEEGIANAHTDLATHLADNMLKLDCITGTTQLPTYTNGDITKIEHKQGSTVVRTDTFIYTPTLITEKRTLKTGESITLKYNFDTNGNYVSTEVV
jgi:hypothetical protein